MILTNEYIVYPSYYIRIQKNSYSDKESFKTVFLEIEPILYTGESSTYQSMQIIIDACIIAQCAFKIKKKKLKKNKKIKKNWFCQQTLESCLVII